MSNSFNQSLLNTNILTSGNSFEDAQFEGDTVFSGTIDMSNITSITGLVDGTSLDEASGVISVKNLGITTTKINDLAITTGKVNDLAITTGKVNDLAITTSKINDLAITTGKVANSSITNDKIVSMDASKLTGTIPNPFDQDLNTTDPVNFGQITVSGNISGEVVEGTAYMSTPATYTNSIRTQSSGDLTLYTLSGNVILNNATYINDSNFYLRNASNNGKIAKLDLAALSVGTRTFSLPDNNGTLALTSDLTTFLTPSSTNNVSNKSFEDSSTYFYDNSVNTKKFSFECSGLSGSRVFTAPDASGTLVLDTNTMTISNKTLTSATITSPTINGTITTSTGDLLMNANGSMIQVKRLGIDSQSSPYKLVEFSTEDNSNYSHYTLKLPNYNATVATLAGSEILTSKTLTNPAFTAGTTGVPVMRLNTGSYLTSNTNGQVEYDGSNILYTNGTGRGLVPHVMMTYCAADYTLSNVNTAQNCFTSSKDGITLAASTCYMIKFLYIINSGTTTHTTAIGFTHSGSITAINYTVLTWNAAANTRATAQDTIHIQALTSTVLNATNTNPYCIVRGEGILVNSTSGLLTPQLTFSSAPGVGANFMKVGSFFQAITLGPAAVSVWGPWS